MTTTRRLAAILAADVVGYSRLMGADEEGTLKRLVEIRQAIIDPAVAQSGGRVVKTTGDGFLIEFQSAVEAVRCALEIQEQVGRHEQERVPESRFQFRIGINVGDVIASDDDIHGDGVNVAARLEALAQPDGILVSATVHATAANRLPCSFDDLGERALKNIENPVRVYRVSAARETSERPSLPLPDKPSIAVLPFQNMSGDPEQEYFADGMVEDITTALSRISGLFVIARNSAFTFKGRAVDVRQVGRELGVRYVLEGSVRKAGNSVRITCQLIEAGSGTHVWADRFDSSLDDIFELQDRVTESVVGAIEPTLRNAEIRRAANKPTDSLDAYDLYLRALHHLDEFTQPDLEEAMRLSKKALEIDPRFEVPKALIAWCGMFMVNYGWWPRGGNEANDAIQLARSAIARANDDPTALSFAGLAIAYLVPELAPARTALDRAMKLNPNSAHIFMSSGWVHLYAGEWSQAKDEFDRAIRLSPLDPLMRFILNGKAYALAELGAIDQAIELLRAGIAAGRGEVFGEDALVHILTISGRMEEAKGVAQNILKTRPEFSLTFARSEMAQFTPAYRERRLASLRAAGIPE